MNMEDQFSFEQQTKMTRLAGLLESKDFDVPGLGSGSFEDFRDALHTALKTQFGGKDIYMYIVATYTSRVCIHVEGGGKSEYYEVPYTVRNGQFDFGTPAKVVKMTKFQKAEQAMRWQQRLAGITDDRQSLSEDDETRVELRECLFLNDTGTVEIVKKAVLVEGKTIRPMTISGIAGKVGVTANGRFYSEDFWQKVVEKSQDKVKNSRFLAELDHPMPEGSHGRLSQTTAKHTKIYMDGDYVRFEAEVLDTQAGETLKALLQGGVSVGASTRVFANTHRGKVDGQDVEIVEEDGADFVGIDLVSEPAVKEAGIEYYQ